MARIPIYSSQVNPSGNARLAGATPEAFGAAIGRGIESVGSDLAAVEQIKRQRELEDAQADAAVKLAEFQARMNKSRQEARVNAPAGAPDHTSNLLKQFDAERDALLTGFANRRVNAWARERLASIRGDIDTDENAFEIGARAAKLTSDVSTAIDLSSNNVFTNPVEKDFLQALKTTNDTIETLALPPQDKEKLRQQARDQLGTSYVRGLAQRDPYGALKMLTTGAFNGVIDGKNLPALHERIEGEIRSREAEARRLQAEQRRAEAERRREIGDRVEDVRSGLALGQVYSADEIADVTRAAGSIGRPELARSVQALGVKNLVVQEYRGASPAELQSYIHSLDGKINAAGGKASPAMLAERQGAMELLGTMKSALKSDPLSWASRAGTVELQPIDWNDPATISARIRPAASTARRYGVQPKFFTDEETAQLQATLATATPQQKQTIARNLATAGGRFAPNLLKSVAETNGVFAHAAGLSVYGGKHADISRRIFIGQEAAKTSNPLPPKNTIETLAADLLGRSLAYQGKTRANVVAAANALYVERAARRGLTKDNFDEELWALGLNEAVGRVGNAGGLHVPGSAGFAGFARSNKPTVVLPVGMDGQTFDDLLFGLTPAELKAGSVGGKLPVDDKGRAIELSTVQGASLFSAGDGRYLLSLDPDGGSFVRGSGPNNYFVLDIRAVQKARDARAARR